jgi:hypothetical protein
MSTRSAGHIFTHPLNQQSIQKAKTTLLIAKEKNFPGIRTRAVHKNYKYSNHSAIPVTLIFYEQM